MTKQAFLDKLAELRAAHCEDMPTPEMAVLTRATATLRRSRILQDCLQMGETAPDFTFIDADNEHQSLYELLKTGPVVLNFFRGLWCMYCKTELEAYSLIRDEMEAMGCHYLAISPQKTTGEDVAEITCHGSTYVLQNVIDLLIREGARLARPGRRLLFPYL